MDATCRKLVATVRCWDFSGVSRWLQEVLMLSWKNGQQEKNWFQAHNGRNEHSVSREKILLSPLHIKLAHIKNVPKLSEAKVKDGIFTGVMLESKELGDVRFLMNVMLEKLLEW